MPDPKKIENAIRRVRNQKSFIQELLIDALGWDIDQRAEDVEEISYEWSAGELRANDLDKHLVDGTIRQIRPFKGNPWGIFILEFRNPDVFATGRGMTSTLRKVLRGLVPSKRKRSNLASFGNENLLFICNHDYKHFRFAHFKVPDKKNQTAPLAAFGWGPDDPIRTLCEFNLNALEWPDGQPDAEGWVTAWSQAFDVEEVTRRFYEDYAAVFEKVEKLIGKQKELKGDDLRMFTQTLFNRLMFLRFMERKHWLTFDGHKNYLRALYAAHVSGTLRVPLAGGTRRVPDTWASFYKGRLWPLFFEGLAVEGKQESEAYGCVPYLNGGLFERSELDERVTDLPDDVFADILSDEHAGGLFYRYNFTVEESTPLDIEVAVDPEMLGKAFEELVTGRHESGSYYTPRPVVSFMCREALKGYLADKLNVSGTLRVPPPNGTRSVPDTLSESIAALVDRHDVSKLKETQAREILAALDDLKAVDPACGSGAYLLGLLQEMIALYRLLYSEKLVKDARTLYDLKLRIISQSLYGVDIDPFATNIAKLRLWLSLAVEAEKPVPLPNLDFKIETGDSLLAPDPQEMPDLFRAKLQFSADVLAMVKNQFFLSHGQEKEEYRTTIMSQESCLRKELAAEYGEGVVDWRIQFAEAFANKRGGFDMVLANPPYVRHELIKSVKPQLKKVFADDYCGTADLYCYFYLRGLQLLRRGGMLAYISSNKWFRAAYGVKLREALVNRTRLLQLIDFGDAPVFAAVAYPCIVILQRTGSLRSATSELLALTWDKGDSIAGFVDIARDKSFSLKQTELESDGWRLETPTNLRFLDKLRRTGRPLREFVGSRVSRGLTTGLNEAFVVDRDTRDQLIREHKSSADILKPYIRGKDINRWLAEFADQFVVKIESSENKDHPWSGKPEKEAERVFAKTYPAIYSHFQNLRAELIRRDDQGKYFWEQRSCKYWREFEKPKIVSTKISIRPTFALDTESHYLGNTAYFFPAAAGHFLLGLLNSSLFFAYAKKVFVEKQSGWFEVQPTALEAFPIPEVPLEQRKPVERLVERILSAKKLDSGADVSVLEQQVDEAVYGLYGLTREEIQLVATFCGLQ